MSRQHTASTLLSAAVAVFQGFQPKLMLASMLVDQMAVSPSQPWVDSDAAAARIGLPVDALLELLRSDPCFKIFQITDQAGRSVISIVLDPAALLAAADRCIVPPAAGYVQGVYPIRPGAHDCPSYIRLGHCDARQTCVYNHPGPAAPPAMGIMHAAAPQQQPPPARYHHEMPPAGPSPWQQQQQQQQHMMQQQYAQQQQQYAQQQYMQQQPVQYPPQPAPPYQPPPPPQGAFGPQGVRPVDSRHSSSSSSQMGGQLGHNHQAAAGSPQIGLQDGQQGMQLPQQYSQQYQEQQVLGQRLQEEHQSTQQVEQQYVQHSQQQEQQGWGYHPQHEAAGGAGTGELSPLPPGARAAGDGGNSSVGATPQHDGLSHAEGAGQGPAAAPTAAPSNSRGADSGSLLLAALRGHGQRSPGVDPAASSTSSGTTADMGANSSSREGCAEAAGQAIGTSSSIDSSGVAVGRGSSGQAGASSSSSRSMPKVPQPPAGGVLQPKGIFLQGIPVGTTKDELQAIFAPYGKLDSVDIIGVKWHETKCAFLNFATEAAAQKALSIGTLQMNGCQVLVRPKVTRPAKAPAGETSSSRPQQAPPKNSQQQGLAAAGSSSAAAAAGSSKAQKSKFMGNNEHGLPRLRGAPNCPYFMGTGNCRFRAGCKFHHPNNALHPECAAAGKMPVRYNTKLLPSYARLVNFTERVWDYESCVEAQLKIWLARHLLAKTNSGCGMFDESAAVPAAPEYAAFPDDAQPLGPYSCTMEEAEQVLQLLWKAQPDDASKQEMPYKHTLRALLVDDVYYDLATDPRTNSHWVRLSIGKIKELLNY